MNKKTSSQKFSIQVLSFAPQYLIFIFLILNPFKTYGENIMNQKCENKPNCVSSFDVRENFFFPALKNVNGPWEQIKAKIESIMGSNFNSSLEASDINYLHFVVTTKIFRFKDDVYFWWDSEAQKLNMKSQSRVGYSDLGANKKRLSRFVKAWNKN